MTEPQTAVPVPMTPLERAYERVKLQRRKKQLEDELKDVNGAIATHDAVLLQAMEDGQFQTSSRVDGASVHHKSQLWAGPVDGNHAALTNRLRELGLIEYLPSKVNSQSFSGYVREAVKETDPTLPLDERVRQALPELADVINVTERHSVGVTGA